MLLVVEQILNGLQFGLLLGTFSMVSIPIDNTPADIWPLTIACRGRKLLTEQEVTATNLLGI